MPRGVIAAISLLLLFIGIGLDRGIVTIIWRTLHSRVFRLRRLIAPRQRPLARKRPPRSGLPQQRMRSASTLPIIAPAFISAGFWPSRSASMIS
jgi:hypothetical protein